MLSTAIGFAAMHVLFKLSTRRSGAGRPSSPFVANLLLHRLTAVLSASYTESTALLGVVTVLWLNAEAHYWWVVLAPLVLSLSRNVVIAMVPSSSPTGSWRWASRLTRASTRAPARRDWGARGIRGRPDVALADDRHDRDDTPNAYNDTMLAWNIETKIKLYLW